MNAGRYKEEILYGSGCSMLCKEGSYLVNSAANICIRNLKQNLHIITIIIEILFKCFCTQLKLVLTRTEWLTFNAVNW